MAANSTVPFHPNGRKPKLPTVRGVRDRKSQTDKGSEAGACSDDQFVWNVGNGTRTNYKRIGERLSVFTDLFRNGDRLGLLQVLPNGDTRLITKASELAPIIADRLDLIIVKHDKITGDMPAAQHLNALLRSEVFLSHFRRVDAVVRTPYYLCDFTLVESGYHDGDPGQRILYVGPIPDIGGTTQTVEQFLDVMDFESLADRTNTVGAALTALLRHHWPGEKPLVLITATKSHAGKGTITEFIRGSVPKADLLYESIDWPVQSQFQRQLQANPDIGVVVFDNVRLDSAGGKGRCIRSAFIESFVTTGEITLASPGAGQPIRMTNRFLVTLNTNDGALSGDLMNRSLSIHLAPKGDVQDRQSRIGNPKFEFLPQNRNRIEAELRGMIERWKSAGRPMDDSLKNHPMPDWARTIGGILKANGFTDFLGNRGIRRVHDDPLREAIAILGASRANQKLRPAEWADAAVQEGLSKTLFTLGDRDTAKGRERGIGVVLKRHLNETFLAEREEGGERFRLKMCLRGGFRRWESGKNGQTRYVFEVLEKEAVAVEE